MYKSSAAIILIAILISYCSLVPQRPVESEYLKTSDGGFLIDYSKKEIHYKLTLVAKKEIKEGGLIEIFFENPEGGEPLKTEHIVIFNEKQFVLQSPPVNGLKAHNNYSIKVKLYSDNSKEKLISTHNQSLYNITKQSNLGW